MRTLRRRDRRDGAPRRRVSYANVASTLALVAAIGGGTAWAASHHYLITSTSQIKPKVLNKLRGHRGPVGATGAKGAPGAAGPKGAKGATGATGAVAGIVTGTASNVTLSAIRHAVLTATASTGGHQLVIAQVAAHRATPQTVGDSIACVLNNLTAAAGTDFGPAVATFPAAGAFSSGVTVALQSVIPTSAGDTVAVSCVGGSAGFVVDNANIALIPMP